MNETPVVDLDDDSEGVRRQVRDGVLSAPLPGPGPDLAVVRARGRRRRRRRHAAQGTVLTAAAAAVVAIMVGVVPDRGDVLVAGPPTAAEVVNGLGRPAPATGPEAVPDVAFSTDRPAAVTAQAGTGRYLGNDDLARYWVTTSLADGVCGVRARVDEGSTAVGCSTVEQFLERGIRGGEVDGDELFEYVVVPDGFDTATLEADGYSEALPNVLTHTSPYPVTPVETPR